MDDISEERKEKDKFDVVEDATTDEEIEEKNKNLNLNRGNSNFVSQTSVYTLLIGITGAGFLIGALIAGVIVGSILCVFEVMNTFMTGIETQAGQGGDIISEAENQFMMCASRQPYSPVVILSGLFGGILSAIPSYKAAKFVSKGKLLRSLF